MKIRIVTFWGLTLAILIGLTSTLNLMAQEKAKAQKADISNIQGTVQTIGKGNSTIAVRTSDTGTRLVVYNSQTKFQYGHSNDNKPGNVSQVKENEYISCAGTFNNQGQLAASVCIYREGK
jgi:hypothetical protein